MKYYDIVNKKQTFIYRNDTETIPYTDNTVSCFWDILKDGEEIEFDSNNFPIKVKYELDSNGDKYSAYLPKDSNNVYKPDIVTIDAKIAEKELNYFKLSVQKALDATTITVQRIHTAIVFGNTTAATQDVVDFLKYVSDLRALLSSTTVKSLPIKPPYPANT